MGSGSVDVIQTIDLAVGSGPSSLQTIRAPEPPRVVIFDCETTGIDCAVDQVIELCIQRGLDDRVPGAVTTWRIRPSVPIHPRAQAVHGIAPDQLAHCPTFAEVAGEIAAAFAEADVIVGYNVAFDIEMLRAEYARLGAIACPDFASKQIVDALRLWQQFEPRSLQHAHVRFVGNGFDGAHSASADVAATGRVLSGMLEHFQLAGHDWSQLASVSDPLSARDTSWVGPSRHLRWERGVIVLSFGRHANAIVHELASGASPARAALASIADAAHEFPDHVRRVCRAALEKPRDEFLAWAREQYGAFGRRA